MIGFRPAHRAFFFAIVMLAEAVVLTGCQHYRPDPIDPSATANALDARSLDDPNLKSLLEAHLPNHLSAWPLPAWDFDALTLATFHFHPDLELARLRWESAQAAVKTAGGRPNPVLAVTPGYSANPASGISPWFPAVTLDVPLETAGKRQRRLEIAVHRAEEARLGLLNQAWQLRAKLRLAVIGYAAQWRRIRVLEDQASEQSALVRLLEQRLDAGTLGLPEVTPARLTRLKFEADLAEARTQLSAGKVMLASAIGVPFRAVESLRITADPLAGTRAEAGNLLASDARDRALSRRADILAGLAAYATTEAELHLEIAKQYPDVHFNPGYQFDQGEHKWSLGLSLELPVLNRNEGPIAEAHARRREAAAAFLALQANVIAEVDGAAQAYHAATDQLDRLRSLRQASEAQIAAIQSAFQAGAADRLELVSARLETRATDVAILEAEDRVNRALGQLEQALQVPFGALEAVGRPPASKLLSERNP
ncbi:MAG: TolC family protein [Verrucomicrobiales bacterium]|nr:TolC family protein [Verrucomicrobiales bacterium]